MTEYTTSSQAYLDYMSARDRTSHWVHAHVPYDAGFYSPSVPPSVIDGLVPSSPPSEADSTDSTPPKMVLRYNDGRPDVPIPHPRAEFGISRSGSTRYQDSNPARSRTHSYSHSQGRTRSGSSGGPPASSLRHNDQAPEEIRILPSFGKSSSHARSKSLPRGVDHDREREPEPEVPFLPPSHLQTPSPYMGHNHHGSSHHQVSFAPPAQPSQSWHRKQAPAIVYAPSHHAQRPQYSPPAMFHHPPQVGPNGVIYSHSAPLPGQYPPQYAAPFPTGHGSHRHTASAHDVGTRGRDFTRSLSRSARRDINPNESAESLGSEKSAGTYYVLPNQGQKVHVISHSPEHSIVTATSTTKSPSSPYGFGKKPFFQRLFGKFSSAGSANDGRNLSRRHSIHRVEGGQ